MNGHRYLDHSGAEAHPGSPDPATEDVVRHLVRIMPLEWKVGQLNQHLHGWEAVERHRGGFRLTQAARREIERWGGLGALYGLFRADPWSGRSWADGIRPEERAEVCALVQDEVRHADASGVGVLVVEEAPHGHQALGGPILPVNLTQGATWDPHLVARAAREVGRGLRASGVHIALVSGLDMLRDPRWGRAEECFAETPTLASALVGALVEGMQGGRDGDIAADAVAVVAKHLAGQGGAAGGRNGRSAPIGPRELREVHLAPVRAAVEAGAWGVMAAYNDIDGVPCCANPWLLEEYLRGELGFRGVVMADGLAVDQLLPMTGSIEASGRAALLAGVDLSLWDRGFTTLVDSARREEQVAAAVDRSLERVLRLKAQLGVLAVPGGARDATTSVHAGTTASMEAALEASRDVGAELAQEGIVLLSDRGVLPLDLSAHRRVALVGPNAEDVAAQLGDYVAPLAPGEGVSVADALRTQLAAGVRADTTGEGPDPSSLEGTRLSVSGTRTAPLDRRAVAEADLVIAVLGGTSERHYSDGFADNGALAGPSGATATVADCGEGADLASLVLPGGQDELVEEVAALTTAPLVAVVVAGRPHVLTRVVAAADVVVWAGYPGPQGGDVVLRALTGSRRMGGALPFTLPAADGVLPLTDDERQGPHGAYLDAPSPVLFPLGFALGQEEVEVIGIEVSVPVGERGEATLCVRVRNTTTTVRERVVTVWAHRTGGITFPRSRELLAFRRVVVGPGQTQDLAWGVDDAVLFAEGSVPGARTTLRADAQEFLVVR